MEHTFMRFPNFRRKALTLSYDDGVVYDEKLIRIMDKYGLKGTFNINSGLFSEDGQRRMTKQQALEIYSNSGHEVAIHGKEHLSLPAHASVKVIDEILQDRIALEEMFGTFVTGMAYALGRYDDNVVDILKKCGVEYARTVISTESFDIPTDWLRLPTTCHHENPRLMELAKEFIRGDTPEEKVRYWRQEPRLFYLWGHSYEFNDANNWHIIEEFAEYIGNREDIWYATNIEIYHYVKAFESLQFSANSEVVKNPTHIDVYICYCGKEVMIPAGETIKII